MKVYLRATALALGLTSATLAAPACAQNIDLRAYASHADTPNHGFNTEVGDFFTAAHGYDGPPAHAETSGASPGETWNDAAVASFGALHVAASVSAPGPSTVDRAVAYYDDILHSNFGPAGTHGTESFVVHLDGSAFSAGGGNWSVFVTWESGAQTRQLYEFDNTPGGGLVNFNRDLTFTSDWTSGVDRGVRLLIEVDSFVSHVAGSANADFSHTLTWGGLVSATTSGGQDVTNDIVITSGSGHDYRAPTLEGGVPEPAGWALMLVGFGGVGGLLRRRRAALA